MSHHPAPAYREVFHRLLPMHMRISRDGIILDMGSTIRKVLCSWEGPIEDSLTLILQGADVTDRRIFCSAMSENERLFFRVTGRRNITLRGHAAQMEDGFLLNLGFGIGLVNAVRDLQLTDADFAPAELAMELLFLHEANRAVMTELAGFNQNLNAAREEAIAQAYTDPLTGLANRRGLELALADLLRKCRDISQYRFAIAHLDLDHFKEVNDRYGHAAGDKVLVHVARALEQSVRSGDVAARVGGDEFVMVLAGVHDPAGIEHLANRIIARIEQPVMIDGTSCRVSASIGIVGSGHCADPCIETLLAEADAALYRSKKAGRGRVTISGGLV